jgi:hypothetical protein
MDRNARLLFILAIVLAALTAMFYWSTTNSSFRGNEVVFSVNEEFEIAEVEMSDPSGENSVHLYKQNHEWRVNDNLNANEAAVDELQLVLYRIRVWQPVSLSENQQVEEMFAEKGVTVKVYVWAHLIRFGRFRLFPVKRLYETIVVGEDVADGESTYMRKAGSSRSFKVILPGYDVGLSSIFNAEERVWRDPVIIDADWAHISSVEVMVPDQPHESYLIKNETKHLFVFYDPAHDNTQLQINVDTARVQRFISSFTTIYYETLLDEEGEFLRKEIMFEQPFMIINVNMKDGSKIKIESYARQPHGDVADLTSGMEKDPNRFYVKVNQGEYAQAQYFVFNRIFRPLSFFKK